VNSISHFFRLDNLCAALTASLNPFCFQPPLFLRYRDETLLNALAYALFAAIIAIDGLRGVLGFVRERPGEGVEIVEFIA